MEFAIVVELTRFFDVADLFAVLPEHHNATGINDCTFILPLEIEAHVKGFVQPNWGGKRMMRLLDMVFPFLDATDLNVLHDLPEVQFGNTGNEGLELPYYTFLERDMKRALWRDPVSGAAALLNYHVLRYGFVRQLQLNHSADLVADAPSTTT